MITCTECQREINPGQKRCNYCNSRILQITASKLFNKTKSVSNAALEKTSETTSEFYTKTTEGIKSLKDRTREKKIINTQNKIKKLQQKIQNNFDDSDQ